MTIAKDGFIRALGLRPHVAEGGYYTERYRSGQWLLQDGRAAMDTIYYMLTDDSPIGHFHKNISDIVHFFHAGSSLRYTTIGPDGRVESFTLGANLGDGEELQRVVPGGHWKASELISGEFGLISEAIVPAFVDENRVIGSRSMLSKLFPGISEEVLRLAWE